MKTLQIGFMCHKELSENETVNERKQSVKDKAFQRVLKKGDFAEYADVDSFCLLLSVQFKLTRNGTVVDNKLETYSFVVFTSVDDSSVESSSEDGSDDLMCGVCLESMEGELPEPLPCCGQQSLCPSCEARLTTCPFCRQSLPRGRGQPRGRGRGRGRGH